MAYENNVYEFPSGQRREDQEAEQPQFLPADVGAETLDAYMNFRQSQGNAEDAFTGADYQRVRALLQTLSPIFTNEGEAGIYVKLQEMNEILATGTTFERDGVTIQPTDAETINTAIQLIELARKEKVAFLHWRDTQKVESPETESKIIPTSDQSHDLERFMDFLTETEAADYTSLKGLFARMKPLFEHVSNMPLRNLLTTIQTQIETGDAFDYAGVRIASNEAVLIATALELLTLAEKQKEAFDQWKLENPDTEEEEEGVAEAVGEQLFGAATAVAVENALTETWKNQTRHFSEEMSKLQKEVTTRRLSGLPHIFPPDFESIVGQFIYRLNRVTEFKPTMIAEFESEFTELLGYFDLRMLRTAGEELDQELPDDPESLERTDQSLDLIDEQLTNLMLLQTSQSLIQELRNVKYRLDLLRKKIQRVIENTDSTKEDQSIAA